MSPVSPRDGYWRGLVAAQRAHGTLLHGDVHVVAEGEAAVEAREEGTPVRQTQEGQLGLGPVSVVAKGRVEPGISKLLHARKCSQQGALGC